MKQETRLLQEAANEIKQLRQENAIMGARLDMFDKMILLFETMPAYRGMGMGEDLVWKIEKHIETEALVGVATNPAP